MSPTSGEYPTCTHCGSSNTLPFEDDSPLRGDDTLFMIFLSIALIMSAYFLFVLSSYILFPLVVFLAIILITRMINKRHHHTKPKVTRTHDYVCLDCSSYFNY